MLRGFDYAVANLEPGEITNIHLEPEEAYGKHEDYLVITMDKNDIPDTEELEEGDQVMLQDEMGRPFEAVVSAVDDSSISFDLNHPIAGKALNFKIELIEVR
jgi:FKBP-type peptidyl-prolyl cis-trans isomerase 2